jgi:hypothetical protein
MLIPDTNMDQDHSPIEEQGQFAPPPHAHSPTTAVGPEPEKGKAATKLLVALPKCVPQVKQPAFEELQYRTSLLLLLATSEAGGIFRVGYFKFQAVTPGASPWIRLLRLILVYSTNGIIQWNHSMESFNGLFYKIPIPVLHSSHAVHTFIYR